MGLEVLEVVFATEQRFGIKLSNEELTNVLTPGDLLRLVLSHLQPRPRRVSALVTHFYAIRRAVTKNLHLEPRAIRPSTRIDAVVSRRGRRALWHVMSAE